MAVVLINSISSFMNYFIKAFGCSRTSLNMTIFFSKFLIGS